MQKPVQTIKKQWKKPYGSTYQRLIEPAFSSFSFCNCKPICSRHAVQDFSKSSS